MSVLISRFQSSPNDVFLLLFSCAYLLQHHLGFLDQTVEEEEMKQTEEEEEQKKQGGHVRSKRSRVGMWI